MAVNVDLGRLYYANQGSDRLYTIDVLTDSVIDSESLPWNVEAMFLNRRLGKLYMASRLEPWTLVFDCNQGAIVDTVGVYYSQSGLMNDRNDKLYLKYGAVVDCRYDSVIAMLPPWLDPCSMAWDAVNNRVFQATTSRLYVYRDDPYGVADRPAGFQERRHATIIRGVLVLPGIDRGTPETRSVLLDISGREVMELHSGVNDVRALAPGVYFVRQASSMGRDASSVTKVVLTE
jgi:YVTN family beta-propeller protein